MTFPVFSNEPIAEEEEREVGFIVDGTYGRKHPEAGEAWSITFECVDIMPSAALGDVISSAIVKDGVTVYRSGPASRFITRAVVPERRVEWTELLRDPDRLVRTQTLVDIMGHLFEEYAARPTGPASDSDGGQPGDEATSEDEPSSGDSESSTD